MRKYTRHGPATGVPMHYGYLQPKVRGRPLVGAPQSRLQPPVRTRTA